LILIFVEKLVFVVLLLFVTKGRISILFLLH